MTMTTYETCRKCGEPKPCACPRITTVAAWRHGGTVERDGPRMRVWDWIEFVLVCAVVWLAVVRPPLPGIDGGCGPA